MKKYDLPLEVTAWIEKQLNDLGFSVYRPKELSQAILKISDNYQSKDSKTDWSTQIFKAAYFSYFMPLNYIRVLKVIDEAKKLNFFQIKPQLIDFGCGPGTSTKALLNDSDIEISSILGIDTRSDIGPYFLNGNSKEVPSQFSTQTPQKFESHSLLIASYALNELPEIPSWIFNVNQHIIIEPSTKQASVDFQKIRNQFIEKGFQILAPCPHHLQCPLSQSKKDWCHDRVYWNQPEWFVKLEKLLPIKNSSLTFSYLIANKSTSIKTNYVRVVGDAQIEKGKTKWMICQNSEREFMSFLKRDGKAPLIYRGDKVFLSKKEKKGNEIRFNNEQISFES